MTLEQQLKDLIGAAGTQSSDFDLIARTPAPETGLRAAAVLLAVTEGAAPPWLYLTKRSSHLRHHPGQVSLPGGKVEPSDLSPEAAALREAQEEIGLDPAQVRLLGRLPTHETVTGFSVVPVIGLIPESFVPQPDAAEVEAVFRVPLAHCLDLERYQIERRQWLGDWRNYYTVPYGPYYIWGATARILRGLALAHSRKG